LPQSPNVAQVRAWLERMVAALTRMRDLNALLTRQLAQSRRARPRSETLTRIDR
jgi:hypothetical protein